MRNIWTIASREYRQYFSSPLAYAVALLIFLIIGVLFVLQILDAASQSLYYQTPPPDVSIIIGPMATLLLWTTPALTMRLLADEQKSGTLELLLTAPVRDVELVVGKWLGSFLFVLSIIGISLIFPAILNQIVYPGIDQGLMMSAYLGIILVAAAFLAIGTGVSALFSNQVAAFIVTLAMLILLWMVIAWPSYFVPAGAEIFRYLHLGSHFDNLARGVVAVADIAYFLSWTALGLFVGTSVIEMRRWR